MQNKYRYLNTIAAFCFLLSFGACKPENSGPLYVKWVFINETGRTITTFPAWALGGDTFYLAPHDSIVHDEKVESEHGEEIPAVIDRQPLFNAFVLKYDGILCDTLKAKSYKSGDGPLGIDHYNSKKIDERHMEYTFRFTDTLLQEADTCK